jgi:DNA-directed RNA polymerase subunit RPC12/RpoP
MLVQLARRVLPHMNVFLCMTCIQQGGCKVFAEDEIINKTPAPWTEEQILSLNAYQKSEHFIQFVCGQGHKLIADGNGLRCKTCSSFILRWAYPWTLDESWRALES